MPETLNHYFSNWSKFFERRLFQHWVMGGSSAPEADRIGSVLEEESAHGVFCRAGRLDGADARVCHEPRRCRCARSEGTLDACRYRGSAHPGSDLRADRVRDRPNGADALSRFEPAGTARRVHREPTGLSGTEVA